MSLAPVSVASVPASSTAARAIPRWRQVAIVLASVELIALYAPTLQWLWERWTLSVWHNAHGVLIPPVVAYLIYDEMKHRRELPWGASPWGFAFLVPALLMHAMDAGNR